jgi:GNAT superfamily N-acetyltransferase
MTTVTVCRAGRGDGDVVADLRREWAGEEGRGDDPLFAAEFARWYESEYDRRLFWIAARADNWIGMVNLTVFARMPAPGTPPGHWGHLGNMYVCREHRNLGVGAALLEALLAEADRLGLQRVVLNPSERSVPLYQRFGFSAATELMIRHHPGGGDVTA